MISEDYLTGHIANYLKRELNRRASEEGLTVPIINSYRLYDAFNVPVQDFPLIKVFRTSSQYTVSNKRLSSIQVHYSLVLPNLEVLLPYLNWVDYNINEVLSFALHDITVFIEPTSKRCEYRTLMSELGTPIYSFLRFSFNVTEGQPTIC
jgi:hypothetical protein